MGRARADMGWGYVHTIAELQMSKSQVTGAICSNEEQPLCLKHKHKSLKIESRMADFYHHLTLIKHKPCVKCG